MIPSTFTRLPVPDAPKHPHSLTLAPLWFFGFYAIFIVLSSGFPSILQSGLKVYLLQKFSFSWSATWQSIPLQGSTDRLLWA